MIKSLQRIAIIGTGLIGGSIGLAIRQRMPDLEVVGFDEPQVLDRALQIGALSIPAISVEEAVTDADVIVIAVPLNATPGVLASLGKCALKSDAIVTDVGSVKTPIVDLAARELPDSLAFVGGHPMAGSAQGGINAADPLLFENAIYVLTPANGQRENVDDRLIDLVEAMGARVLILNPEVHDRLAAAVSHLPQLLAVGLVNAAFETGRDDDLVSALAAGGFRDMTRISESPFDIWEGILASNHRRILDALASVAATIQQMRNRLIEEDYESIRDDFERAARRRRTIPKDMRGFISPIHHVMVGLADRPGALHHLTGVLSTAGINIKDLELVKIREGAAGSFRIGFSSSEEAGSAREVLERSGFSVHPG
jgi:prephenate dehydrogenase